MFPLVVVLVHEVDGDAALSLARRDDRLMHALAVHAFTAILRQQGGVDVHDAPREGLHHGGGDQAQEARQDDEVHPKALQFVQHGAILELCPVEEVAGEAEVPGALHDAGIRLVAADEHHLGCGMTAEMFNQALGVGSRSAGEYGDAFHAAKVRSSPHG